MYYPEPNLSNHTYAVIIAGGAGTRLWPLSREARPKQFQRFTSELSLLQHMVEMTSQVVPLERILIMATSQFAKLIQEQLPELPAENILHEPARRDNGPAIALAMIQIYHRDSKAEVTLLWSDHTIQDREGFAKSLRAMYQASSKYPTSLIMMGAKPSHPDTQLGYIKIGDQIDSFNDIPVLKVAGFTEKPDLATATKYVRSWQYLWNIGYKTMAANTYLRIFNQVHPELIATVQALTRAVGSSDQQALARAYEDLPKLSDEFLFTQHVKEMLVIPADVGWSDIGTWNTLHEVLKGQSENDLVTRGSVISLNSANTLVFAKDRPIAVLGLQNCIVVDDGDVILVMDRNHANSMKELMQHIKLSNPELL